MRKAWDALVAIARNHATITYGELGDIIGTTARRVGHFLYPIQDYCRENRLPPLTILVVQSATRRPGSGMGIDGWEEIAARTLEVQNFDWSGVGNPF